MMEGDARRMPAYTLEAGDYLTNGTGMILGVVRNDELRTVTLRTEFVQTIVLDWNTVCEIIPADPEGWE